MAKKYWKNWCETIQRIERYCLFEGDPKTQNLVHEFARFLTVVLQMYNAFRQVNARAADEGKTPRGVIRGEEGVRGLLGISRNAIYVRCTKVGCSPDRFRVAAEKGELDSLLMNNAEFNDLVEKLKARLEETPTLAAEIALPCPSDYLVKV